jgi:hypothetical protein
MGPISKKVAFIYTMRREDNQFVHNKFFEQSKQ